MIIRPETTGDHQSIFELTKAAFAPMPFGDDNDAYLTGNLRDAGDLILSLVADDDGVIGHVAFSSVTINAPGRWIGLGPISVTIDRQRQGIGSALVAEGLAQVKDLGFDGCVLIGNPSVYGPMGFVSGDITYRDLAPKLVQWHSLTGLKPQGEILFAPALEQA